MSDILAEAYEVLARRQATLDAIGKHALEADDLVERLTTLEQAIRDLSVVQEEDEDTLDSMLEGIDPSLSPEHAEVYLAIKEVLGENEGYRDDE